MTPLDDHYSNPKLAEIYDAGNGWSSDRDFYLDLAGKQPLRILDLGCGTGLLGNAYAERGHIVTGVDPAASMLELASAKPHGSRIEWVLAQAQTFASENRYDLIIMTGHAFQVLLEPRDVAATFRMMKTHLAAGGRIVFESRNPAIDWVSRWNRDCEIKQSSGNIFVARRVQQRVGNRIRFITSYRFTDVTLESQSELRFWTFAEIDELLQACGLRIAEFFGDWDRSSFAARVSEEMIFVVQELRGSNLPSN